MASPETVFVFYIGRANKGYSNAENARWFRIITLKNETTANPIITLEKSDTTKPMRLIAMPGIVEVYPLCTISFDPNNPP